MGKGYLECLRMRMRRNISQQLSLCEAIWNNLKNNLTIKQSQEFSLTMQNKIQHWTSLSSNASFLLQVFVFPCPSPTSTVFWEICPKHWLKQRCCFPTSTSWPMQVLNFCVAGASRLVSKECSSVVRRSGCHLRWNYTCFPHLMKTSWVPALELQRFAGFTIQKHTYEPNI